MISDEKCEKDTANPVMFAAASAAGEVGLVDVGSEDDGLLRRLLKGMLVYGFLLQAIGAILAPDVLSFSTGLWLGIAAGCFMLWHMQLTIRKAVWMGERGAQKHSLMMYAIRLLVVMAVFLMEYFLGFGNVIATFLGILGIKPAVYIQAAPKRISDKV